MPIARYVAEWGVAQMCLCNSKCHGGKGLSCHFGASSKLTEKNRATRGYSIAVLQDMGPLRAGLGRAQQS